MRSKSSLRVLFVLLMVALLAFGGTLPSFAALVEPIFYDGPNNPAFEGCTGYKFELPNQPEDGRYYFGDVGDEDIIRYDDESPLLPDGAWVDLTFRMTEDGPVFDWEASHAFGKVLVKGGRDANIYDYENDHGKAVKADEGLHAPVNPSNNQYYGLSHIIFYFCGDTVIYGSIAGLKFHDLNADGVFDMEEEYGLEGWEIELYDEEPGEDVEPIDTTTTDEFGIFSFEDLDLGTYWIKEVLQEDWYQSTPLEPDYFMVELTEERPDYPFDKDDDGLYFGNYQMATKSGYKWFDANADGIWYEEDAIEGWTINLWKYVDDVLTVVDTTETDKEGYYSFALMPGVAYYVSEAIPSGWVQTYPNADTDGAFYITGVGYVWGPIVLNSQEVEEDNNFGNFLAPTSETAWAFGGGSAIEFTSLRFGNWGWTNGPLGVGSYEFDLYAGAGQNDTDKGTLVGKVLINYTAGEVTVTYSLYAGYTMSEAHLHVGSGPLPANRRGVMTNAPGQFQHKANFDPRVAEYTVTVSATGNIYVAAHAVVWGYF